MLDRCCKNGYKSVLWPKRSAVFCIGIAGGTASGKTTLGQELLAAFPQGEAAYIVADTYYRPLDHLSLEERTKVNFDHPDSLELDLFHAQLKDLIAGHPIKMPIYDFVAHNRRPEPQIVQPAQVVVVEGILALYQPEVRSLYDLMVFVEAPDQVRLARRIERDMKERGRTRESVLRQWEQTVLPMHHLFCQPSKQYAQMVVDGEKPFGPAVRQIVALARRGQPSQ